MKLQHILVSAALTCTPLGSATASTAHDEVAAMLAAARVSPAVSSAAPRTFPVTPHPTEDGTFRLRLRVSYFKTVYGGMEVRRHQHFVDRNLKLERKRDIALWSVVFEF